MSKRRYPSKKTVRDRLARAQVGEGAPVEPTASQPEGTPCRAGFCFWPLRECLVIAQAALPDESEATENALRFCVSCVRNKEEVATEIECAGRPMIAELIRRRSGTSPEQ